MVKSMTGYGQIFNEKYALAVEVRSLNSKYIDVTVRLPKDISDKEYDIRQKVGEALERGKITVTVEFSGVDAANRENEIMDSKFETTYHQLEKLAQKVGAPPEGLFSIGVEYHAK